MRDNYSLPFRPTFGNRPQRIAGRDQELDDFLSALDNPVGAPGRCTLFLGQRDMGKTALLIEIAERAHAHGFATARVTAYDGMPDEIIETIQRDAASRLKGDRRRITGFNADVLGFDVDPGVLDSASEATRGFPYLMQLIGYFALEYAKVGGNVDQAAVDQAIADSQRELARNVFKPILDPLSDNDRRVLEAMAQDEGPSRTSDVKARLGVDDFFLQPYRKRLIEAKIIEAPRRGELVFAVPYLADHLRSAR